MLRPEICKQLLTGEMLKGWSKGRESM